MIWDYDIEDEPILYTFYDYLIDKHIITYKLREALINSIVLKYHFVQIYYNEYKIYCEDNDFKYESKEILI